MLLSTCCEDDVVPHVLPFIREHIENPDWRYRDASVMAFGSILEGPDLTQLKALVMQVGAPPTNHPTPTHSFNQAACTCYNLQVLDLQSTRRRHCMRHGIIRTHVASMSIYNKAKSLKAHMFNS